MSYIFIDVDEARRCAALIDSQAERLTQLMTGAPDARTPRLDDFCRTLVTLAADLSEVTESYASADERLKTLHHMTNEGGRLPHGQ